MRGGYLLPHTVHGRFNLFLNLIVLFIKQDVCMVLGRLKMRHGFILINIFMKNLRTLALRKYVLRKFENSFSV